MVGRPNDNGVICSVNIKQAIEQNILLIGDGMQVEIKAVAAQYSVGCGVVVVVKGCLISHGGVKNGFNQTFFLDGKVLINNVQHYYIINDIFMYDDEEHLHDHSVVNRSDLAHPLEHVTENETDEKEVSFTPEDALVVPEKELVTLVPKVFSATPTSSVASVVKATVAEKPLTLPAKVISATPTNSMALVFKAPVVEKPVTPVAKVIGSVLKTSGDLPAKASETPVAELIHTTTTTSVAPLGEAPKISYPLIVNAKDIPAPIPVRTNQPSMFSAPTATKVSYASSSAAEQSFSQEVDCCSVFVGNLPVNVTVNQLREEFKKFGAIKQSRIQVKRNEKQRFCFAFLEFELASAAASAIKASPLMFGGHSVFIKEKRRNAPRPLGSTSWRASGREYRNGGSTAGR